MTQQSRLSPHKWVLYLALLAAGFETGRGLARLERGESFFPSLFSPVSEICCTMSASLSPLLV